MHFRLHPSETRAPGAVGAARILRRGVVAAALLAAGFGTADPAGAQVRSIVPAFENTSVIEQDGMVTYMYRLRGPARPGTRMSEVVLDIGTPKTDKKPEMLGTRGRFLFDAMSESHQAAFSGHPPLFIGTPDGVWSAALYVHGVISWGATRYGDGRHGGVLSGDTLSGFELRSPALIGLRRYVAAPYRRFDGTEGTDIAGLDSNWVVTEGTVLAPGWMADEVTGAYLAEQLEIACAGYLLDQCGRYLLIQDAILEAERTRNDRSYTVHLTRFLNELHKDRVAKPIARTALNAAVNALLMRPPSRR